MGIIWREEREGSAAGHGKRLNVLHLLQEESEPEAPNDELERELSERDDDESCPHLVPANERMAR